MFCFFRAENSKGAPIVLKTSRAPHFELTCELYADRLFAAHGNWREPAVPVVLLSMHDGVELFLQGGGDWPHRAPADFDLVYRADCGDLGSRARKESLVGNVEHLARDH